MSPFSYGMCASKSKTQGGVMEELRVNACRGRSSLLRGTKVRGK